MAMGSIEYFYSTHSAFAYIGSERLMEIAEAGNREIIHRPVDLRRVISAAGGRTFRERTPAHRAYFFGREIERWAEYRGVEIINHRPTHHDNSLTLSSCMIIAGVAQGLNVDRLAHAILQAHWSKDADHADRDTLAAIARSVGFDPDQLLAGAAQPDVQAQYEANTVEAIERSVFGSPTYFVDGDMFYGQDRLVMVARAFERPFSRHGEPSSIPT